MTDKAFVKVGWQIAGIRRAPEFFGALVEFLPLFSCLYFEGTSINPDVQKLLEANAVSPMMTVPTGTLWPKPTVFHVIANEDFLRRLAEVSNRYANPEICDHFHAYHAGRGL